MLRKALLVLCLGALLATTAAVAQDQQLASVLTVHVKLGHQQDYDSSLMGLWKSFKKAGVDRPILVSNGDGGTYSFVAFYSSWSDFAAANAKVQAGFAGASDVLPGLQKTLTHSDWEMWAARPDLSYVPDNPRVPDSDQTYTRVVLLRPHADHAVVLGETLKEGMALRKKHGIRDAASVFQLAAGANAPAFAILIGAKDEVDYHVQNAKNLEAMGDAWQTYVGKVGAMLRDFENQNFFARPDLAYQP